MLGWRRDVAWLAQSSSRHSFPAVSDVAVQLPRWGKAWAWTPQRARMHPCAGPRVAGRLMDVIAQTHAQQGDTGTCLVRRHCLMHQQDNHETNAFHKRDGLHLGRRRLVAPNFAFIFLFHPQIPVRPGGPAALR